MNCYLDLAFSTKLVEKYKQALPTFRTPGTNTFKGDPVFNAMMAINLDEHRIEYVEKNPEQNVSVEQLRTIVRNGLRDGGDLTEGVDYIFPDRVDKDEDEIEDTKTIAQTDGCQMTTKRVKYDTVGCVSAKDPLDVEDRKVEVIDLCDAREAANNKADSVPDPVLEPRPETKPRDQAGLTREWIDLMFYDSEEDGDEGFDEDEGEIQKSGAEEDDEG